MLYGRGQYKNGKAYGELRFDSGKVIKLTEKETEEYEAKIRIERYIGEEMFKRENHLCVTCGQPEPKDGTTCDHIFYR